MRPLPRRLLTLTAGAAVAGALSVSGRRAARRWHALRQVDPALRRNPMVVLPLLPRHDLTVRPLQRLVSRVPFPTPEHAREQTVPAPQGRVPVVVHDVPGRQLPSGALVWVHGGGRVIGVPAMDHVLCARLAREAGVLVVAVDYRLAPQHPFPAALDDVSAVLAWVHEHAADLGVDPARVAVGGASAGGGLAAEAVQRAHDEGVPVALQLLVYPMLDDRTLPGTVPDRSWLVWTPRHNRHGWSAYLGHPAGEPEPRPYAVAARRADLTGLPPAWIGVGDQDLFLDEDLAYARRLREAGVEVQTHVQPGMPHGADSVVPDAPSTREFTARLVEAVRAAIGAAGAFGTEV